MKYFFIFLISFLWSSNLLEEYFLSNLPSNGIVEMKEINDSTIFIATGGGLGKMVVRDGKKPRFQTIQIDSLEGAISAIDIKDNYIAVSGYDYEYAIYTDTYEFKGNGVSISKDEGLTWRFLPQSIDENTNYLIINNDSIKTKSITTNFQNITWDLAIHDDYIYVTNWSGGLRRFNIADDVVESSWEIIPLPMDSQFELVYGDFDSYEIDPTLNLNQLGWSIDFIEDTLWVGTGNGINKGYINNNGNIEWVAHFNTNNGLPGNWVYKINQSPIFTGSDNPIYRVWVLTWATGGNEKCTISYTDDGGENWMVSQNLTLYEDQVEDNVRFGKWIYDINFDLDNNILLSTEIGLLQSSINGVYWEKFHPPRLSDDRDGSAILSSTVYTTYIDQFETIYLGTSDGIATTADQGLSWDTHHFWFSASDMPNIENHFFCFPNPFYLGNAPFKGDNYVRFIFDNKDNQNSSIDIFDFSMDHVINLNLMNYIGEQTEIVWNGRDQYSRLVSNGVYFCRLKNKTETLWTKVMVINTK